MSDRNPRVVIVGGGFGGLAAAKALKNARARVVLIDRTNHHLFQPLLYQVAISVLTPGQIASPIRAILRSQRNTTVILGEVTGVDKERRCVFVNSSDRTGVPVPYDYLILATGAAHSYFGNNEFEKFAPGLKTVADAVAVRNKILTAFETAEAEEDPSLHRDLLTFVLVGGGPTGVEMASAIATRFVVRFQFVHIIQAHRLFGEGSANCFTEKRGPNRSELLWAVQAAVNCLFGGVSGSFQAGRHFAGRRCASHTDVIDNAKALIIYRTGLADELPSQSPRRLYIENGQIAILRMTLNFGQPIARRTQRIGQLNAFVRHQRN